MTLAELIQRQRGEHARRARRRNDIADELNRMNRHRDHTTSDPAEAELVRTLLAEKSDLDAELDVIEARLADLQAEQARDDAVDRLARESHPTDAREGDRPVTTTVRIGAEAHTYARGSGRSFLRDLYAAQTANDPHAQERLYRHGQEMTVDGRLSERALTSGGVAAFVPPAYLQAEWAEYARGGRQTANLLRPVPLPPTGMAVNVPKLSTGTSTAVQATENTAVSETNADDTQITANVITIAGQQTISRQLLERSDPGMDEVILQDLAAAYAVALDAQIVNGSGAMVGVLNQSGINAVTYTDASPTVAECFPKIADAVQRITGGRFAAPTGIVMHPRRWAWFLAALDASSRPLVVPAAYGPNNPMALGSGQMASYGTGAVGSLLGLPVFLDANIPTNLGTGTNEDRVVVARWEDNLILEDGGGVPHLLKFEATAAANLSVLLVAYGYAAATFARQPAGISVISGTGLVTPTF